MDNEPLIVAVDFGTAYTGVAYVHRELSPTVQHINDWPGKSGHASNKVPTSVTCDSLTGFQIAWGFESVEKSWRSDPKYIHAQLWKDSLYQPLRNRAEDAELRYKESHLKDVHRWTRGFLQSLYEWVSLKFRNKFGSERFERMRVEFVFSVPGIWNPSSVSAFKAIALQAGWGSRKSDTLSIGLTEAESAAVCIARAGEDGLDDGDVFIVCDVGAGTTDVTTLQTHGTWSVPQLTRLTDVETAPVGSALIDLGFHDLVTRLLESSVLSNVGTSEHLPTDVVATAMMNSTDFKLAKFEFNGQDVGDIRIYNRFLKKYRGPRINTNDGELVLQATELKKLFDAQVERVIEMIDCQIKTLSHMHPTQQVNHICLCGGFAESPYLIRRLKERYADGPGLLPQGKWLIISVSKDSSNAVSRGSCIDKLNVGRPGGPPIWQRTSTATVGFSWTVPHILGNPEDTLVHVDRDLFDKEAYVKNGVKWLTQKEDPFEPNEPFILENSALITRENLSSIVLFNILVYRREIDSVPLGFGRKRERGIECSVSFSCDLKSLDLTKAQRSTVGSSGLREDVLLLLEYQAKISFGAPDLKIELYFYGEKASDDSVQFDWRLKDVPEGFWPNTPVDDKDATAVGSSPDQAPTDINKPNADTTSEDEDVDNESDSEATASDASEAEESEPYTQAGRALRREEVLQRLMSYFMGQFSACCAVIPQGCQKQQADASSSIGISSGFDNNANRSAPSSLTHSSYPSRIRRPTGGGSDNEEDQENQDSGANAVDTEDDMPKRLACPYFKRSPWRYRNSSSCTGPGWWTIHRMKEHIYTKHRQPIHCIRCYSTFKSDSARDEHQRNDPPCETKKARTFDGIDKIQENSLKSRKRKKDGSNSTSSSEVLKWMHVYKILFPLDSEDSIPSPHYDLNECDMVAETAPNTVPGFEDYEQYLRRDLPLAILRELERRLDDVPTGEEERLRNLIPSLFHDLQIQMFNQYRHEHGLQQSNPPLEPRINPWASLAPQITSLVVDSTEPVGSERSVNPQLSLAPGASTETDLLPSYVVDDFAQFDGCIFTDLLLTASEDYTYASMDYNNPGMPE